MTRKKSAAPLAMRFLVCLALLVACAGQAGADRITIPSWLAWQQSTQVNYDDAVPWGGVSVSSLPALETFTLSIKADNGPNVANIPGSTTIFSGPGVRYYHALFDMPDFAEINAHIRTTVDNSVQIFINRREVALAGSLGLENMQWPPLGLSLYNGMPGACHGYLPNGLAEYNCEPFDRSVSWENQFFNEYWIRGGINEVIVVVRNLSSNDYGAFSFLMEIDTTPNHPPVAYPDFAETIMNTPVTIAVTANDQDDDNRTWNNQTLRLTAVTQGANGSVVSHAADTFTYTPNLNFRGYDAFTYTLSDGLVTTIGTVNVNVRDRPPSAMNDEATTNEDTPVSLLVIGNDMDEDGDALIVTAVTQGENGSVVSHASGMFTYTPKPNFNGQDFFTYYLGDSLLQPTAGASVTVTVSPVNDPPTAEPDLAHVTLGGTATVDVVANDLDIDSDALTVTAVTQPAFGTAEIVDNKVVYTNTAPSQSTSDDSLSYTVSDGDGGSATATLKLKLVARLPALSVTGPLTVKAGLPLRFTVKAKDPNYSPPATLSTQVVSRTLPAGASFRNDTLSWTPQSDQVGTYNLVFGARTNTSPGQLLTKAVVVTVEPNRYPDFIRGGEPRIEDLPGRWYEYWDYDWDERGYASWFTRSVWLPPERRFYEYPGVSVRQKKPTSTFPGRGFDENALSWFFWDTNVYGDYSSGFSGLSRPAVGDIDGVGLAEVVVGAGTGSGGLLAMISPTGGGWTKIINAGWDAYNQANGETWPAVGNLNGTDYILVGLGKGGLGYIRAFLWRSGEIVYGGELYLPDAHNYNATNGTTRPTVGDLTGDSNNEIVVGVDGYGDGIPTRVYIAALAADGWHYTPLEIPAVAGLEDARYNCETWPAIGDLDGDGKNELVINVTRTVNGTRQPVGFGVWTSALADGRLTFKLQAFKKAATFGLPALGDVFTPDGKKEIVLSQGPGSYTQSVFGVEATNGGWTILPEGILPSYLSNPYPAFGEVLP